MAQISHYTYSVRYVHILPGLDEDVSEINTVFVNWKAEDLESGIEQCQWAIGW